MKAYWNSVGGRGAFNRRGKSFLIEESFIELLEARAAGMPFVVSTSSYTGGEDVAATQRVIQSLYETRTTLKDLTELFDAMHVAA